MISTVAFEPWHLECAKADLKENFEGDPDLFDRIFRASKSPSSFIHTILWITDKDKRVLGIIAGTEFWRGVVEVFTILTRSVRSFPIAFTKEVKRILHFYERALCVRRFQASARIGFKEAPEWLRTLGFGQEGLMQKFGPEGDDYLLFARITV